MTPPNPDRDPSPSADVLVVGGGVIGLATAWFLARAGLAVRVLEQARVGAAASWGNCGLVTPSHADPLTQPGSLRIAAASLTNPDAPFRIAPTLDPRRLAWFVRFALHCTETHRDRARVARAALLHSTRQLVEQAIGPEDAGVAWSASGLTTVYQDPARFDKDVASHEAQRAHGMRFEAWSRDRLLDAEPLVDPRAVGAIHAAWDGHVDPRGFGQALAMRAREAGADIVEGVGVGGLLVEGGRVVGVQASSGPIRAAHTVLAAGAWSARLARQIGVRLPVEPAKGYSITWSQPVPELRTALYFYEPKVVATPWPHGFRLGSTMEFVGHDDTLDHRRIDLLLTGARRYLTHPLELGEGVRWAGWRPMSVDEVPIIGVPPRRPGLMLACGHGVLGVSQSLATGRLVSELVTGVVPHVDPAPYHPDRVG